VCLSEFMFGAPLYKQRQVLMGLPDPSAIARQKPLAPAVDSSAPGGSVAADGGVEAGSAAK